MTSAHNDGKARALDRPSRGQNQPMSTKRSTRNRSTDPRPTYIALGRDAEGREHVYRTYAEEIVVIRDGQRVHIEDLTEMKDNIVTSQPA